MGRVIVADRVGHNVVPGQVHRARAIAESLLREAQAQAVELVHSAQQVADALVAAARAEATLQAREETIHIVLEASAARDRALADARSQLVTLAMAVAAKIVDASLNADPAQIEAIVAPLLARARRARRLELRLHPDDVRALAPRLAELETESGVFCAIRLEADASLGRGSCVLVSDLGTLDARLETRLDLVRRALEPWLADSAQETAPKP